MTRTQFKHYHRQARLQNLGTLAFRLPPESFQWFLHEVYDLRFPCVGIRSPEYWKRGFDPLRPLRKWKNYGYTRTI